MQIFEEKNKKMQYIGLPKSMVSARLSFMTRLAKKRGITQAEEDKSLILRRYVEEPGPIVMVQILIWLSR